MRTLFENTITLDMIEEIAAPHTAGCRLLIGTLDRGESVSENARLFVIVNGKIGFGYNYIDAHWAPRAKRTINASLDEATFNGILRTYLYFGYKPGRRDEFSPTSR